MTIALGYSSLVPSLPPPSPRSPPEYPDLCGKRLETARLDMREREISFLEEELISIEGLHPASRCCKEIVDFVVANSDPLLPKNKKNPGPCRRFWKWLCRVSYFNPYRICCYCCRNGCKLPHNCCDCKPCTTTCLQQSTICTMRKWCGSLCPKSHCCEQSCGCTGCCVIPSCCKFGRISCPSCCTGQCSRSCSCPSCPKAPPHCCCCTKSSWKKCSCICTRPRMMG